MEDNHSHFLYLRLLSPPSKLLDIALGLANSRYKKKRFGLLPKTPVEKDPEVVFNNYFY